MSPNRRYLALPGGCLFWMAAVAALLHVVPAAAQTTMAAPAPAPSASPGSPSLAAFQSAYATSFYAFDACGDQLAGKIFRKALTERVTSCPFSADAKKHFQTWSVLQRRRASQSMAKLIEANGGGLPVKLDGMTGTCHEQRTSPAYLALRDKLELYDQGLLHADGIVPESCDAATISP